MNNLLHIGDVIECKVSNPSRATLSAELKTPEAVAIANDLIANPDSGWTKREPEVLPEE